MKKVLLVVAGITLICVGLFAASWSGELLRIRKYITVGKYARDGRVTAQSDGTLDLFSGYNSSGTETFTIDKDGDLTALTVSSTGAFSATTISGTTGTFTGDVTIDAQLYVDGDGVSDVQFYVDGSSGQAVDIMQVRLYDGTQVVDVDADGDVTIRNSLTVDGSAQKDQLVVQGHSTMTGKKLLILEQSDGTDKFTVDDSGNTVVGGTLQSTGALTATANISLGTYIQDSSGYAADPCAGLAIPIGSLFFNETNKIWCFCDSNTDDVKLTDNSTACF